MNNWRQIYLSADGRLNRKDFFLLFYIPWAFGLLVIISCLGKFGEYLAVFYLLLSVWPYCATLIKRFHDFGRSWKYFILYHVGLSFYAAFIFSSIAIYQIGNMHAQTNLLSHDAETLVFFLTVFVAAFLPLQTRGDMFENEYGNPHLH